MLSKDPRTRRCAILFLPDLNGGGAERAALNLLKSWADDQESLRPVLVLRRKAGPYLRDIPENIQVVELGTVRSGWRASLRTILGLARILRELRPVALISFLSHPSVIAAKVLSGCECKVIASVQNPVAISCEDLSDGLFGKLRGGIKKQLVALSFRLTDGFFPISAGIGSELRTHFAVDDHKIMVLPNSVEIPGDPAALPEPPELHGLRKSGRPVLVTAGRLVNQKGYDVLIAALKELHDQGIAPCLVILGEGQLRESLVSLVKQLGLDSSVRFLGFKSAPLEYFAHADAFVLASRYEGFGNVIIEALACGCPVISTDAPYGPSDILGNSEFGLLVPVERPDLLAKAIGKILASPEKRQHYSVTGRKRAADYERSAVFRQFIAALEDTIATPHRPPNVANKHVG